MALSKETAKKLHTGVKVATLLGSVGLCFTGVGTLAGLSGVTATVADLAGGAALSKGLDAVSKKADKAITKNTVKGAVAKTASKGLSKKAMTAGMMRRYMTNSHGRSVTPTFNKATDGINKMQADSDKHFQRDLVKAGIQPKGNQMTSASELAQSM